MNKPLMDLLEDAAWHRFVAAQNYIAISDSMREAARAGWPVSPAEVGYVEQAGRQYDTATKRLRDLEAIASDRAFDDVMVRVFG